MHFRIHKTVYKPVDIARHDNLTLAGLPTLLKVKLDLHRRLTDSQETVVRKNVVGSASLRKYRAAITVVIEDRNKIASPSPIETERERESKPKTDE